MQNDELYPLMQAIDRARRRVEFEDLADQGTFREVMDALHAMEQRGWVDIRRPLHGDNRLMSAHGIRLSAEGLSALSSALRDGEDIEVTSSEHDGDLATSLGSLEEKRVARGQFMERVYQLTGGSRLRPVDANTLGQELAWQGHVTRDVVGYLADEGLLERAGWGGLVSLTHDGVREVEQLLLKPSEPTHHFAPTTTVIVHGDVNGQLQAGTQSSSQSQANGEGKQIAAFLHELKAALPQADMEVGHRQLIQMNVDLVESALEEGGPEAPMVQRMLPTLRDLAVGVAGNGAFLGLTQAIQALH